LGEAVTDAKRTVQEVQQLLRDGEKLRGLGDAVARVTKKLGVKPCTPCEERRRKLNKLVPFGK